MKQMLARLKSTSPISFSRYYAQEVPREPRENNQDYEERTWRNRVHSRPDGIIYIPAFAFKNCLDNAAKYLSKQIPGKGKSTYTRHFASGVMVTEPLLLKTKKDEVQGEWRHVPPDGQPGVARRVLKCFPVIPEWSGEVTFIVLDEIITIDVLREHLDVAGQFVGLGSFRPQNRGIYGRFIVESVREIKKGRSGPREHLVRTAPENLCRSGATNENAQSHDRRDARCPDSRAGSRGHGSCAAPPSRCPRHLGRESTVLRIAFGAARPRGINDDAYSVHPFSEDRFHCLFGRHALPFGVSGIG